MKKVWKYTALTFLLLLGLCCVGILYLFFIPNSHLFNITYINNNSKIKSEKFASSAVTEVVLNSRSYNVNVLSSNEDNYSVEVFSNAFGFVLSKHEHTTISSNLKNGVLTFNIDESYGFALKNNSYVNLFVPKNKSVNLNLSNLKATTLINSSDITINNLSYSTTKGNCNFISGKLNGNLDLNINTSIFTISKEVETNSNKTNLKLTSGKFDASNSKLGDVEILENKNGIISIKECGSFKENLSTAGGQIYINQLTQINVQAGDTKINVETITDGAIVTLTKSGDFRSSLLKGSSDISTNTGSISIGTCESEAILHSESGAITVTNAQNLISVKTNSGNVSVNFNENANNSSRILYATIQDGSLHATNVSSFGIHNPESTSYIDGIHITGKGSATIYMSDVYGNNAVYGNNGTVKIITNATSAFKLTTSSNSGSVRVNLLQIPNSGGYTTTLKKETNVNGGSASNSLTVSTDKGSLTVVDSVINANGF